MIALAGTVLATSLVGSLHCAGMCGGFACLAAGDGSGARRPLPAIAYNAGRLITYVALGLIAGALGAGLDRLGAAAGLSRVAAIVAGSLMVLWGASAWLGRLGTRLPAASRWRGPIAAALRRVTTWHPVSRAFALGLVTTLLPCGFLYAYVAIAAGTGHALAGALVMAVFWVGTVPLMAGLAFAAQGAVGVLRLRLRGLTAPALVVLGLLTLAGKMSPVGGAAHGGEAATHAACAPGSAHGGR